MQLVHQPMGVWALYSHFHVSVQHWPFTCGLEFRVATRILDHAAVILAEVRKYRGAERV